MQNDFQVYVQRGSAAVRSAPWQNRSFYTQWLAQTYYFVRHSTRLLASAAGRMSHRHEALFRRFTAHVTEEQGHERLLVNDLEALGCSVSDFAELPLTTAFYETQYSMIARRSPYAFLGYVLFLEGLAANVGPHIHAVAQCAYGQNAVTFIRVHADDDPSHVDQAFALLDGLTSEETVEVNANLAITCDLYSRWILALVEEKSEDIGHGNRQHDFRR